ncbi:MAG: DUF4890 domain-containing protein [Saprospiraceae bacterium]|nr:DUF4890 domain-containing protein [Saprospiraceae bacterium]MDW8484826.1 DUF4890 domain-containing protein [Saprospiraceae bacterium]
MNNKHIFWLAVGIYIAGSELIAQPEGGRRISPEQRAEQQTALMKERLVLSDAQVAKVQEINVKYARQMQEVRQKNEGDWEAMRAQLMTLRQAQDQELQTVLTQEQWQQWLAVREEVRGRRDNWRMSGPPLPVTPPSEEQSTSESKERKKKERKNRSRDANPNGNR